MGAQVSPGDVEIPPTGSFPKEVRWSESEELEHEE